MPTARTRKPPARAGRAPAPAGDAEATTRERMLDAALAAFSELGFDGASTRAIAARAGVNQGLIPYYFGSKEALWKAAVERAFAELREVLQPVAEASDPAAGSAETVRRFVRFAARRPEFSRLMTDEGKRDGPRMRWIVDCHVRPMMEVLVPMLERQVPTGLDPVQLYYVLVGAATHLFHQAPEFGRVTGRSVDDPAVVAAQEELLVTLLETWRRGGEER